jgi:hypothetical protein
MNDERAEHVSARVEVVVTVRYGANCSLEIVA